MVHEGSGDGRRLRHAGRRDEVLDAAVRHVLAHGWSASSLRSVAEGIGLSHRAVLYHFGSKERLLLAVATEVRRQQQQALVDDAVDGAPVDEMLRRAWTRISAPEHLPYVRLHLELQVLGLSQPDRFGFLLELVGSWTAVVESLLERVGVDPGAAGQLATWVYGLVRGLQLDLVTTGDRDRVDAAFADAAAAVADRVRAAASRTDAVTGTRPTGPGRGSPRPGGEPQEE